MKKLLLTLMAAAATLGASAGAVFPSDFLKEFDPYQSNSANLNGWTVYAPEGQPSGSCAQFFTGYSPSNAVQVMPGELTAAFTISQYADGQASDTWLITPEFTVTADSEVVGFTVQVYGMGSNVTNNYYVYISDGGVEKEDFELWESATIKGSTGGAQYINQANKRFALEGYKGKKIRLAFVNAGNTTGMMGFGPISVGSWYYSETPSSKFFDNLIMEQGGSLDFTMRVSTPVTAKTYTIDFKTSGGFEYTATETRSLRLGSLTTLALSVPGIQLKDEVETYTMTFLPDFEGAIPAVFTGRLIQATRDFEAVGVMEEGTGTWCGWCPFGAAALDYYVDHYNGKDGNPKAIGIAIHDGDPMMISSTVSDYYTEYIRNDNNGGFPAVTVNRMQTITPSPNPRLVGTVLDALYAEKSYAQATLKTLYFQDGEVWADYDLVTSCQSPDAMLAASAIVVENNVQGMNDKYNQASYLTGQGYTQAWVKQTLGEEWMPYLEDTFGVSSISYKNIQYNHVARGAFPSYAGKALPQLNKQETYSGRVHFNMPSNVDDMENTAVVLIIRNASDGKIVAADEIGYDSFTFTSGVEKVKEDTSIGASISNGQLTIKTEVDSNVDVYTVDGRKLLSAKAEAGDNAYNIGTDCSVVIVNVYNHGSSRQFKLINR